MTNEEVEQIKEDAIREDREADGKAQLKAWGIVIVVVVAIGLFVRLLRWIW